MTLQEAGHAITSGLHAFAAWFLPGILGSAIYMLGSVVSLDAWSDWLKVFGVVGALVWYMWYTMSKKEPRVEQHHERVIGQILEYHSQQRQEDRDANSRMHAQLCESMDRNTEAFENLCSRLPGKT